MRQRRRPNKTDDANGVVVGALDEETARIVGRYIETELEAARIAELLEAQNKAEKLFHEIEQRSLIRPGITESALNEEIFALAKEMFGITTYWHKRIVRAGRNSCCPTLKTRRT